MAQLLKAKKAENILVLSGRLVHSKSFESFIGQSINSDSTFTDENNHRRRYSFNSVLHSQVSSAAFPSGDEVLLNKPGNGPSRRHIQGSKIAKGLQNFQVLVNCDYFYEKKIEKKSHNAEKKN